MEKENVEENKIMKQEEEKERNVMEEKENIRK
jgi:hypothetical protein